MDSPPSKRFRAVETPATQDDAGRSWWCRECEHPAFSVCMDNHDVSRPKVALRRGLNELKTEPDHARSVWDEANSVTSPPEEQKQNVLTALRLLREAPTTCKLTVQQDGFEDLSVEWRLDDPTWESLELPESLARSLLKPAVVALAARGELKREPTEAEETTSEGAEAEETQSAIEYELDLSRIPWKTSQDRLLPYHPQLAGVLHHVRDHGLRRLAKLSCSLSYNCGWALKLLQNAAPTLEDLELSQPLKEHICTFVLMPRLRRLVILEGWDDRNYRSPKMTALPPLSHPSRLQRLHLYEVAHSTVRALLLTFGSSLEELKLMFAEGLVPILEECRLPRLSKLLLTPNFRHSPVVCAPQVAALRRVLPGIKVRCCSRGCPQQGGAAKSGNT